MRPSTRGKRSESRAHYSYDTFVPSVFLRPECSTSSTLFLIITDICARVRHCDRADAEESAKNGIINDAPALRSRFAHGPADRDGERKPKRIAGLKSPASSEQSTVKKVSTWVATLHLFPYPAPVHLVARVHRGISSEPVRQIFKQRQPLRR